jgi:hypothetical protein
MGLLQGVLASFVNLELVIAIRIICGDGDVGVMVMWW